MKFVANVLFFLSLVAATSIVNAVSFQVEKDRLTKQFNCSNEKNLAGSDFNSFVWKCSDEFSSNHILISRSASSKEVVDTLQWLMFSENNTAVDDALVALSRSIASKYAKQSTSDIVNIIKNCQQQRNFQSEFVVDAGCIVGPVKTERHVIVRMNAKNKH